MAARVYKKAPGHKAPLDVKASEHKKSAGGRGLGRLGQGAKKRPGGRGRGGWVRTQKKRLVFVVGSAKSPGLLSQAGAFFKFSPGDDLLSHDLNTAVSSAMKGLTSGFGMEPGVPPSLWPPGQMSLGFVRKVPGG